MEEEDMMISRGGGVAASWCLNLPCMDHRLLSISTAADALPTLLGQVVTQGKITVLAYLVACTAFLVLGFPFWLLSLVLPEWAIYALLILGILFIGKNVMRVIVFPGSSHKVIADIEAEFARYSVRMLQAGAHSLIDVASVILSHNNSQVSAYSFGTPDFSALRKRAHSYRDRVLEVYASVLAYLLEEPGRRRNLHDGSTVNDLHGSDVGNLSGVTLQAKSDGRLLLALLRRVLQQLKTLDEQAPVLTSVSNEARETARALSTSAAELRDMLASFKPQGSSEDDDDVEGGVTANNDLEESSLDAVRQQLEQKGGSAFDALKAGLTFVMSTLDPPLHTSIFGLDVQRGCVLSRYRRARQFWVQRPNGGRIDVIHVPAVSTSAAGETHDSSSSRRPRNHKAVLYCNPNAGLIEVSTGMSLAGGNVVASDEPTADSWTDFYTENGYDIYIFNYAGFGRSHGRSSCATQSVTGNRLHQRLYRILRSACVEFKPTPDTLRADATAVGKHLIHTNHVSSLVIHGESIGGLAACGAARELTSNSSTRDKIALLICDRTFCNLPAVAQRLLGRWSGTAVQMLEPRWNTDVAADFLAVSCPKVVANDAADMIINDASSLKAGISFSAEIKSLQTTKGAGCMLDAPLEYRLTDWENVGVHESSYRAPIRINSPRWPGDRNVALAEAFHFAACVRRIGKVATANKSRIGSSDHEEGIELSPGILNDLHLTEDGDNMNIRNVPRRENQDILSAWKALSCCDGLCGAPLGRFLNECNDGPVWWLCSTLTFGGQIVVEAAEKRLAQVQNNSQEERDLAVDASDFDTRPVGYEMVEARDKMIFPIPIPEVIATLKQMLEGQSEPMNKVRREVEFCVHVLEYTVARLCSPQIIGPYRHNCSLLGSCGAFKKLHCGHNNQFSAEERLRLKEILEKASNVGGHGGGV